MEKTPIMFMESVPVVHGLDSKIITDVWLYRRYDLIDENHEMSEGERRAWLINGKATADLGYAEKFGTIYSEGTRYFNGTHIWKRFSDAPSKQYVAILPQDVRQTSDTWIEEEWEVV